MTEPLVEYDAADGAVTIIVSSDQLANFPKFINDHVIKKKIGYEEGFCKVRITDASDTTLETLVQFCSQSLATVSDDDEHPLHTQKFFYGSKVDDVFGFKTDVFSKLQLKRFIEKLSDPTSYQNVSTCCIQALNISLDEFENHIWEEIRCVSSPGCAVRRVKNVKGLVEAAALRKHEFYFDEDNKCSSNEQKIEHPETHNCRKKSKKEAILYASGIPVKTTTFPITEHFNMSELRTILDMYPHPVPGLSCSYMYVGKNHSGFSWHIEDAALFSANYHHYGAPSIWYFVAPKDYSKFVNCMKYFPLDLGHVTCNNVLGHKYVIASKGYLGKFGIPVKTVIQQEKELIITYPFAAHMGFKTGWCITEAINFADPFWVEPAIFSPKCSCLGDFQINLDLKEIIALTNPSLLPLYLDLDYLGLAKVLKGNKFLCDLGVLPQLPPETSAYTETVKINNNNENESDNENDSNMDLGASKSEEEPLRKETPPQRSSCLL
ncbi:DNA damage-responsive transcriptional repressor RPH1 [Frankliniella fusca]|uniref:DNA damage-responsive transcriptional repressor RPH1 n=1 Tax=Frankliniella fusca TaxID=407009 RepID=A0AAE1GXX0_9NEOP|nr:DNA damage-responsive transcriptional repressor RPH1 [Frankliniella fusca]